MVLIGGSPGIGKSTLTCGALGNLGRGRRTTSLRLGRGVGGPGEAARRAPRPDARSASRSSPRPTSTPWWPRIEAERPDVCVIDSVQMLYDPGLSGAAGLGRARCARCAGRLMRVAKERRIAVILVGHVTKEGAHRRPARARAPGGLRAQLRGRARAHLPHRCARSRTASARPTRWACSRCATAAWWRSRTRRPRFVGRGHPRARLGRALRDGGLAPAAGRGPGAGGAERARPAAARGQRRGPQPPGADTGRAGPARRTCASAASDVFVSIAGRRARGRAGCRSGDRPGAGLGGARASAAGGEQPMAAFGELGLTGELRQVAHADRRLAEAAQVRPHPVSAPGPGARHAAPRRCAAGRAARAA